MPHSLLKKGPKSSPLKTALITGGGHRIGRELALHLVDAGYAVALHYHTSQQKAQQTANLIRKRGGVCHIFSCDLLQSEQVFNLILQVKSTFSRIDLLINNASIFEPSSLRSDRGEVLERHWKMHLMAPYLLMGEFARLFSHGHIINILDTHIKNNKTLHLAYLLSKKALADLTKLAAVELAPGIRVNGVAPGLILPPQGQDKSYLNRLAEYIPLKQKGHPQYVCQAVMSLIDNVYLTGQIIFVDGGEHLLASASQ
jgi:NAD(P)-dependent dehydrogenase (short-subunit alcohol dehydrogenase family)